MLEYEGLLRFGAFIAVLTLLGLAEWRWPRRPRSAPAGARWFNNLAMLVVDAAVLRLGLPVLAVGWAVEMQVRGWGLFNRLDWPPVLEWVLAFVLLDLIIYLQHRLMHFFPWLWRLHRVHHSDLDFDVSTGVRFHPLEILLSMLIKLGAVTLLGAPAGAVLLFEIMLNLSSLFEHANLRLPPRADQALRTLIVTPDMHRVHHSIHRPETDSNFGFNLSLWDRVFASYTQAPRDGQLGMTIGLAQFREAAQQRFTPLLLQPFQKD